MKMLPREGGGGVSNSDNLVGFSIESRGVVEVFYQFGPSVKVFGQFISWSRNKRNFRAYKRPILVDFGEAVKAIFPLPRIYLLQLILSQTSSWYLSKFNVGSFVTPIDSKHSSILPL